MTTDSKSCSMPLILNYIYLNAAELLEFDDYIPPYATATNEQISTGVNYASGGAGIRDETGSHLVNLPNSLSLKQHLAAISLMNIHICSTLIQLHIFKFSNLRNHFVHRIFIIEVLTTFER